MKATGIVVCGPDPDVAVQLDEVEMLVVLTVERPAANNSIES